MTIHQYIISFLLGDSVKSPENYVYYGKTYDELHENVKVIIVQSDFFDDGVYGTDKILPKVPFEKLPETDIPFFFGKPLLEQDENGRFILYADIVASAYFLLSRYEEIIKPECRDIHGRFLAKDSVVFQQGYGMRPLVDEWGRYLRDLLRKVAISIPCEKHGFRKIYLTHDVDVPFLFFRKKQVIKQFIKNIIHRGPYYPCSVYKNPSIDPQYTFPKIIEQDSLLQKEIGKEFVEPIYFIIAAGSKKTKDYCNIELKKFQELLNTLINSGATLGLHISYEAGLNPNYIQQELERMLKFCKKATTKSRHHFLRWIEPEHIDYMENSNITDDFTLQYADSIGFRVGTCRPYYFINPKTKRLSTVIEHPLDIMECSLDIPHYMGLSFQEAVEECISLIDTVYEYNGELNILFHNPIWSDKKYYGKLYETLFAYLISKNNVNKTIKDY